jgi:curved DNA-binding protein CbpA
MFKNASFKFKNIYCKFNFATKFDYNILYDPDKDYYKVLELKEDFCEKDLKKQFYSLSKRLHPDTGGNEESYKVVTVAYDILKDSETKSYYDKLRKEYFDSINKKRDNLTEEFIKKEFKKENSFKGSYYDKRQRKENNHQYYNNNKNFYSSNSEKKENYNDENNNTNYQYHRYYKYNEQDYYSNNHYDYNKDIYEEYINAWKHYANSFFHNNKNQYSNNPWDEFKINRKNKPFNIIYPEFKPDLSSRLHPDNRTHIKKLQPLLFTKYGRYFITDELDPFKITDNTFKLDYLYNDLLTREDDSETINARFKLLDFIKLYNKNHLVMFSSLILFLYYLNSKL